MIKAYDDIRIKKVLRIVIYQVYDVLWYDAYKMAYNYLIVTSYQFKECLWDGQQYRT